MNKVYTLIFNVATGNWSVASELTASHGRKASTRLGAAMATVLLAAAGPAFASDTVPPSCEGAGASQEDPACSAPSTAATGGGIGTLSTDVQNRSYIAYGDAQFYTGAAQASGNHALAIGGGSMANGLWGTAIGFGSVAAAEGAVALGMAAGANGTHALALGTSADVAAGADSGMAIGYKATSSAIGGTAIGADSAASGTDSVALGNGSLASDTNTVSIGNSTLKRRLVNLADGDVSATSTDAINGAQLNSTNARVTATEGDIGTITTNVSALDGRVTSAETNITTLQGQIGDGTVGLVRQDATTGVITVAADKAGASVNLAGTDANGAVINRAVSGVADGALSDTSTDAVNGAQLNSTNARVTATEGDIGTITTNVNALDGRVTANEGNITTLQGQIGNGTVGLVRQDTATGAISVAGDKAGASVNFAGTDAGGVAINRTLSGIAEGELSSSSTEAVNGAQLNSTNDRVTAAEGHLGQLDGRTTVNEGSISTLNAQLTGLSNGSAGVVTYDATAGRVNVGGSVGGDRVDFGGTDGGRRLGGVANGINDDDAATLAQLKAAGLVDPNDGRALSALVYDDAALARATLGGAGGTVIGNLADGRIAAGSLEAVNGGQAWQMNADWQSRWNALDGRVGSIEAGIADGSLGGGSSTPGPVDLGGSGAGSVAVGEASNASATGAVAVGNGADASRDGAVAVGNGAGATGTGSVAVGAGATATGDNAAAIGAGSLADRDNEVSMGSRDNERVVSNVAHGTRPTDAVNLGQLDDRFAAERDWANGRFQAVDKRMDRMGAMNAAMVNMAVSAAGVHTTHRVGAGVGFQNGRSALSVGYQHALSERATLTVGGSFSGSEASAGFGAGFGW